MTAYFKPFRVANACLVLLFAIPSVTFSQEFSPFSPAFILQSGVAQSSTSLGVNWYNGQSSSPTSNSALKISSLAGSESLSIGLPYDIQVGAGIAYNDWVSKSPSSLNVATGFTNPNLFGKKVWFGNTDARLNLTAGVTPNTDNSGLRGLGTRYNAGLAGVFILNPTLVGSFGVSQFISEKNGVSQSPNETQLSGTISKTVGLYLLNLRITGARYDSQIVNQVYRQSNYGLAGGLQVSRQFMSNIWGAIAYDASGSNSTYLYGGSDYKNKNLNNSLVATVNILF